MTAPVREWVVFDDPSGEARRWEIDVTFLTSRWQCIYGAGCQGVLTAPAPEMEQGCCSYGAHYADDDDRRSVEEAARLLTDDDWQYARQGRSRGVSARSGGGAGRTRLVDDACIFLNRPGFPGGAGCALHRLALRTGVHHSERKPDVCWQVPLRRVDRDDGSGDGTVVSRLTEFARDGWGDGGAEFAWWCTEAPEAFTASEPVYRSLETELRRMLGDELYAGVAAYLDARIDAGIDAGTAGPAAGRRGPARGAVVRHPAQPVTLGPTRRGADRARAGGGRGRRAAS